MLAPSIVTFGVLNQMLTPVKTSEASASLASVVPAVSEICLGHL
ncbi:hypothetical protein QY895_02960 [Latilactobacillus sakei]